MLLYSLCLSKCLKNDGFSDGLCRPLSQKILSSPPAAEYALFIKLPVLTAFLPVLA